MQQKRATYDLIIIGGGVASTFLCLSLFKKNPRFKILIIEKTENFPQKIGESIIDMAALFLQSLDIDHILEKHTGKTGVRFLFNESNSSDRSKVAEFASPTYPGLIKAYHLKRGEFDQQLIEEVAKKGVEVLRPAKIVNESFEEFNNELDIVVAGEIKQVKSRWLVDATGRARFIPQKLNWQDKKIGLNTGAIMAHVKNIAPEEEWDTPHSKYWDTVSVGLRKFSTTHLMRKGCWWWIIRLDDETTSIGIVFDKNQIQFDDYEQFFLNQIQKDAQLSILTKHAEIGSIKEVKHLPYVSEKLYVKGIALIGESGAFLDPFISPGIEMIGQQSIWLADLFSQEKKAGKFNKSAWDKYQKTFHTSYASRLSIYEAGYTYMHSYDIFTAWLKQGNFMYFARVVYPAILFKAKLKVPLRFNVIEGLAMIYFRNRFEKIMHKRERENRISQTKAYEISYSGVRVPKDIRFLLTPFHLMLKVLSSYLKLEWEELTFFLKAKRNPKSTNEDLWKPEAK